MNSPPLLEYPRIGRLPSRALSLVGTFSLFASSVLRQDSCRNGVVAIARTKTNHRGIGCGLIEERADQWFRRYKGEDKMPDHGRGKGGKGLGKGGAKRHRKVQKCPQTLILESWHFFQAYHDEIFCQVLRDNIQGITKPAIRRLARRGGVKRISGLIYEEVWTFAMKYNFPIYEEVLVWEQFDFCKGNSLLTLIFAEHFPCGYFLGSLSFFRSEPCFVCSWRTWCATQWPTRSMQNGKPFSPLMLSTLSSGKVAPCMALAIEGQFKSLGLFWDSRWHHGRHSCHQGHVCSQTTRPLWLWLLRCCVLIQIFWSHTLGLNLVRFPNSQEGRGTWLG